MKSITITITPAGFTINANELIVFAINPEQVITENIFLKTIKETASVCLN